MCALRCCQASTSNPCTRSRTSKGFAVCGIGAPKFTVTGYGIRRGIFHRKRPLSKLKMLPQTPSSATGMIGASTSFMMRSNPRRNGSRWPMRVIWPSAKMQTTSPFRSASLAVRRAWIISRGRNSEEMGMARRMRANGLIHGRSYMPLNMMKRTCRSVDASSRSASTNERWLHTKRAPPFSGIWSRPSTRIR